MTLDRNQNVVFENRVDYPYWAGLKEGEVRLQRCSKCKKWTWPAEWRCGDCGSWDLHWEAIAPEGVVFAWERTHYPFHRGFVDLLPYVTLQVEFPQAGGRRVIGLLRGPEEGLKIGAKVKADIQKPSERTQNLPALWWRLA